MSDLVDRAHLSIGEVLNLLKDEFPDITISKIRFLESQGLLDPERTPSGYRKFYDEDIDRLRWILRQQRENFLPLKVIKGRLQSEPAEPPAPAPPTQPAVEPVVPTPAFTAGTVEDPVTPVRNPLDAGMTGASLTLEELCGATGLDAGQVAELERFAMIGARAHAGGTYYDEDALLVARLASGFMKHGVEARHLRMYRTSAEREASVFEQLILPMIKQRNPVARRQALDKLAEMAHLGGELREALLRRALREYTEGS